MVKITHVLDCIADPAKNRVIAEFSDHVQEDVFAEAGRRLAELLG